MVIIGVIIPIAILLHVLLVSSMAHATSIDPGAEITHTIVDHTPPRTDGSADYPPSCRQQQGNQLPISGRKCLHTETLPDIR